jgi:hypothetical protein
MTLTSQPVGPGIVPLPTTTVDLWQVTTSATQISATATTTLTVNVQFDGNPNQTFPITINWGGGTPLVQTATVPVGSTPFTHLYPTNPNKSNPAAAIPIAVSVDDGNLDHTIEVDTQAAVPGTGFPDISVVPQTTSTAFILTTQVLTDSQVVAPTLEPAVTQENDLGLAPSEVVTSTGRQVVLRIVSAIDAEGPDINVSDQSLNDLPKLFNKLPDGHYRVYLSEDGRSRLVIDVVVRQGRPVDPSQDSDGTSERPPTGQIEYGGAENVATDAPDPNPTAPQPIEPQSIAPQLLETIPAGPQLSSPAVPQSAVPPAGPNAAGSKTAPGFDAEAVPSASSAPVNKSLPRAASPETGAGLQPGGAVGRQAWEAAAAGIGVAALVMESRSDRVDELMAHSTRRTFSAAARLSRKLRRAAKESPDSHVTTP